MLLTCTQLQCVDEGGNVILLWRTSYLHSTDLFVATNYMNAYNLIIILESIDSISSRLLILSEVLHLTIFKLVHFFPVSSFSSSSIFVILIHKNGHRNPLVSPGFILFFLSCCEAPYRHHYKPRTYTSFLNR